MAGPAHWGIFQLNKDCKYKIGNQKNNRRTPNLDYTGGKNFNYISNINMEIESQDLTYLQSRGFTGRTLEEAIEWFRREHSLTPIRQEPDLGDLKQLILILKIRSL